MHGAGEAGPVDLWVAVLIVTFCIALSAFFSGSETAMTAASGVRMYGLESNGDRCAKTFKRLPLSRGPSIADSPAGQTLSNIHRSDLQPPSSHGHVGLCLIHHVPVLMLQHLH